MRKLTSILFIVLFLFNLFGYKAWFYYLETQSNQRLQTSLDKNNYSDKDLITIKVPLSLPYFSNWSDFEQYDGSIEISGQHYNYVKRKVYNDTLILLCIPNHEQDRLSNIKNDYAKLVSGHLPAAGDKANSSLLIKLLITGYRQENISCELPSVLLTSQVYKTVNNNSLSNPSVASPWQPPDTII